LELFPLSWRHPNHQPIQPQFPPPPQKKTNTNPSMALSVYLHTRLFL